MEGKKGKYGQFQWTQEATKVLMTLWKGQEKPNFSDIATSMNKLGFKVNSSICCRKMSSSIISGKRKGKVVLKYENEKVAK